MIDKLTELNERLDKIDKKLGKKIVEDSLDKALPLLYKALSELQTDTRFNRFNAAIVEIEKINRGIKYGDEN